MRVLITRPRSDAEAFAKQLHAQGHTTVIEPLIDIAFADGPNLDLRAVQAVLLTSANGARAAARRTTDRATRVFAVGPATAAEATALGFRHVSESTGEGVDALAHMVREKLNPTGGSLLHITGTTTAGNLKAALTPSGFSVRVEQAYDARAATQLSDDLVADLTANRIHAVTFFSPRTAAMFATLAPAANVETACANMSALTLSSAIANALAPLSFRDVLVAAQPTTAAMLALLTAP